MASRMSAAIARFAYGVPVQADDADPRSGHHLSDRVPR
jgi:hypothetical protein